MNWITWISPYLWTGLLVMLAISWVYVLAYCYLVRKRPLTDKYYKLNVRVTE